MKAKGKNESLCFFFGKIKLFRQIDQILVGKRAESFAKCSNKSIIIPWKELYIVSQASLAGIWTFERTKESEPITEQLQSFLQNFAQSPRTPFLFKEWQILH